MKKAALLVILFACFTFALALPAASAANNLRTNDTTINNDLNTNVGNNRMFNRAENDLDRTMNRLETGANRTANRVETGVNRAANQAETGMNRAFGTDAYDRYDNNAMNRGNFRTNAATTANTTANRGFNWGWLGLLGLLGLAGMRNRERDRA